MAHVTVISSKFWQNFPFAQKSHGKWLWVSPSHFSVQYSLKFSFGFSYWWCWTSARAHPGLFVSYSLTSKSFGASGGSFIDSRSWFPLHHALCPDSCMTQMLDPWSRLWPMSEAFWAAPRDLPWQLNTLCPHHHPLNPVSVWLRVKCQGVFQLVKLKANNYFYCEANLLISTQASTCLFSPFYCHLLLTVS